VTRSVLVLAVTAIALAGGVGAGAFAASPPAAHPEDPTWSPDGTQIAFAAAASGGSSRLQTMRARDGGGKRVLYSTSGGCCAAIAWTESGRIVFASDAGLFSVGARGGKPATLATEAPSLLLSPDRLTVAFDDGCGCGHGSDAIGIVGPSGGAPTIVAKPAGSTDTIDGFTPDGTQVIFTRSGASPTIMAVPVAGGPPASLQASNVIGWEKVPSGASEPEWSPDGRWIAFVGNGSLQLISTGTGDPTVLVPKFARTTPYSWSPTGMAIAYVTPNGKLATVNLQGQQRQLWNSSLSYAGGSSGLDRPQWSPDGSELVFAGRSGATTGVWVVGADGRALKQLA
jgi:Tol biopolymer transport system component